MKGRIDVLENNFASLKFKSENLLNDVNMLTHKRKTLDVRKYKSKSVHKNAIPYENGFIRPKNNENYEFVIKNEEKDKWISKMRNNKTNPFGSKIKWVPKSLLGT